jgi:hypothetical protein
MKITRRSLVVGFIGILMTGRLTYAMNLLNPDCTLIRPPYDRPYGRHAHYHTNVFIETGFGFKNFNENEPVASPLQIWQKEQDGLAMLKGFGSDSPITALSNQLNANDDGVRGHFAVQGDLDLVCAAALTTRFFFLRDWWVSVFMPIYMMKLKHVCFADLTKNNNDADYRVKTLLTDDFVSTVRTLGHLDLLGWERSGVGDLSFLVNWYRDFPQMKEVLKNARINWRLGLSVPTGKRMDLDTLFALPFGYDGACSMPFGVGLDLMFGRFLQAGLDVQLTHIFGHTRDYRIKTDINQTELILLQRASAYKDYGLTQRFNLYVQMNKFYKGLSCLVGYHFVKHGRDRLALQDNTFSNYIANSAESLREWTSHQIFIDASYDFAVHTWDKVPVQPYLSWYARIPFNGKRFTGSRSMGFVLAFDF